jgi:hypothetical protein
VPRVLLVLRGPIDTEVVKQLWLTAAADHGEVAFCYEMPADCDGLADVLLAQRTVTEALRRACGEAAERIAVFAVSDRDGERVSDIAREWGATVVGP